MNGNFETRDPELDLMHFPRIVSYAQRTLFLCVYL